MATLRPRTVQVGLTALFALLLGGCASSGPGAAKEAEPEVSRIETEPAGASVFMEGGFVGTTPCAFLMPAKKEVTIRIERPGYQFVEELLRRNANVAADAPEGVGWEEVYFWNLTAK